MVASAIDYYDDHSVVSLYSTETHFPSDAETYGYYVSSPSKTIKRKRPSSFNSEGSCISPCPQDLHSHIHLNQHTQSHHEDQHTNLEDQQHHQHTSHEARPGNSGEQDVHSRKTTGTKATKSGRKGGWSTEEETYARSLIKAFQTGFLSIEDGTSLRSLLSLKLRCNPMRVSKKFFLGKQFFTPTIRLRKGMTAIEIEQKMQTVAAELELLEAQFLAHSKPRVAGMKSDVHESDTSVCRKRRKLTPCKAEINVDATPAVVCKMEEVETPSFDFDDVAVSCFEILNDGFESEGSEETIGEWSDDAWSDFGENQHGIDAGPHKECPYCQRTLHAFTTFGDSHFCFVCGLL
jgi:hypothetical protein